MFRIKSFVFKISLCEHHFQASQYPNFEELNQHLKLLTYSKKPPTPSKPHSKEAIFTLKHLVDNNFHVPVVYMYGTVRNVLRRARSITRGIGRDGPWKSRPFGPKKTRLRTVYLCNVQLCIHVWCGYIFSH
jgi:hypothetical protein